MMDLLPPSSTAAERAISMATARAADLPVLIDQLWRPDTCPIEVLPWLAWALSVDDWSPSWSDERKRQVVAASIEIHRRKGTVWSIRRALKIAGLGDAVLVERESARMYDDTHVHDGSQTYGLPKHWAEYRVIMSQPITIRQGDQARAILKAVAPVRCHLSQLDFVEVSNIHDAAVRYDGSYSHGVT